MKIRNGFVSNSSSSSFIVAKNQSLDLKVRIEIEVDLNDYVDKKATTIEELITCFEDCYGLDARYMLEDPRYVAAKKVIGEGKTVYFGSFSSETGSASEKLLCDEGLHGVGLTHSGNMDIIESEGGY